VENSEISENHLKAKDADRQLAGLDGVGQVPKYRQENREAKGRRRKVANEAGTRFGRMLIVRATIRW
jgi:hypothetical protein